MAKVTRTWTKGGAYFRVVGFRRTVHVAPTSRGTWEVYCRGETLAELDDLGDAKMAAIGYADNVKEPA